MLIAHLHHVYGYEALKQSDELLTTFFAVNLMYEFLSRLDKTEPVCNYLTTNT